MSSVLRKYQQEAVDAVMNDICTEGASLVVMPTGSGKSHVIAHVASRINGRILVLQPSRELVYQNMEKLISVIGTQDIGVYSAGFGRKEYDRRITFATIQSVYTKPELFRDVGLVILDEAHMLAPRSLSSMYTSFISAIGNPKVIGLTATPFRNEQGYIMVKNKWKRVTMLKMITRARHKSHMKLFWRRIVYIAQYNELLKQGYLSPIEYIDKPLVPYESIPVNVSHSDFDLSQYSNAIVGMEAIVLRTVVEARERYGSVLVFCPTIENAVSLRKTVVGSEVVIGGMNNKDRARIVQGFKDGSIRVVFNVGTLTTGFDKPDLSCIILLRPTRSLVHY
jgi:DNA repair protein RadD